MVGERTGTNRLVSWVHIFWREQISHLGAHGAGDRAPMALRNSYWDAHRLARASARHFRRQFYHREMQPCPPQPIPSGVKRPEITYGNHRHPTQQIGRQKQDPRSPSLSKNSVKRHCWYHRALSVPDACRLDERHQQNAVILSPSWCHADAGDCAEIIICALDHLSLYAALLSRFQSPRKARCQ